MDPTIGTPPRLAPGLLCALLVGCGAATSPPTTRPNLLLVSIDSLRPDHLGCYGYERDTSPRIDALAARGVRFEAAISTTSWTLPSHGALFTGLFDSAHGLVDNGLRLAPGQHTLAEALGELGYETAGFFGGPYLHPLFGLGQGFETYESCMAVDLEEGGDARPQSLNAASHADVTGPRTRDAVLRWADARAERGAQGVPYFLFVHLWDVHYDYLPPAEYVELFDPDYEGTIDGRLMSNPRIRPGMPQRDLEHVLALYDAEIRFTDAILGEILDGLEARDLLANTLVVVLADHGEEFFEHGGKGHNRTLFDEVLRIPTIVTWDGVLEGPRVVGDQVQLVDWFPTLLRLAGGEVRPWVQGRDLLPLLRGESLPPREALCELLLDGRELRALRTNEHKAIEQERGAPAYLFDLAADPRERAPIEPADAQERRRAAEAALQRLVERTLALRDALAAGGEALELTPALRRELEKLGYLGEGR